MADRMIPCPACSEWPHVKMENCSTCKGNRSIPDRRRDGTELRRLLEAVDSLTMLSPKTLVTANIEKLIMALVDAQLMYEKRHKEEAARDA